MEEADDENDYVHIIAVFLSDCLYSVPVIFPSTVLLYISQYSVIAVLP